MFNLELDNFRCFKKEEFDFSKVNILIGENSSGKSSLLKFILALKQTMDPSVYRDINLSFKGAETDLGGYKDVIYYNQEKLPLRFSLSFGKEYDSFFKDFMEQGFEDEEDADIFIENQSKKINKFLKERKNSSTRLSYTVTKELSKHESIVTKFSNKDIGQIEIIADVADSKKNEFFYKPTCHMKYKDFITNEEFTIDHVFYNKEGFMSIVDSDSLLDGIDSLFKLEKKQQTKRNLKLLEEKKDLTFLRIAYLLVSQNYLRFYLSKITFVNPINTKPSRVYLVKDEKASTDIKDIEDVVEFFGKGNSISKAALKDFNSILNNMELGESIEIVNSEQLPVRELKIRIKDLVSNISDVGYGVSLQLPMLLNALLSEKINTKKNSILLIEQPELHLHPKLHANFIETLVKLSTRTSYFIETHSEHIIRKLQALIKNKQYNLKSEDVSIYYFRRVDEKSIITKHIIKENGLLEPPFPEGFYDNSYNLAKQLLS